MFLGAKQNQNRTGKKKIASGLNVAANEIIFTSCGTESNNLIIRSCVEYLGVTRIITSDLEHKCVKETTSEMGRLGKVELLKVKTCERGEIDYDDLEQKLKSSDKNAGHADACKQRNRKSARFEKSSANV